MNEIEIKKNTNSQKWKNWFFEKKNKIDKPLAKLTKMRREMREKTQVSNIKN
jgi:hypothetical protein